MKPRKIIHLDLDAFFCSVEELKDPALRGKPFAVGGRPDQRGVVSSCSYAARMYGVHSAMPMSKALRTCSQLIVIGGNHSAYSEKSHQVMNILQQLTPLVEQVSIDEAFLDVSDLPEPGMIIAKKLQTDIDQRLGLPCSLGVASNKLVAKIATNVGKAAHHEPTPPRAIRVVPPGEEADFLAPLDIRELWGVGPKTAVKLHDLGIHTIGDLANRPEEWLVTKFGKNGFDLARRARGIDDRGIDTEGEAKSISQEVTFALDVCDFQLLQNTLREQAFYVGRHLRRDKITASVVRIKLRWPDFSTHTRQESLECPTDQDSIILAFAMKLFLGLWSPGKYVRLLGLGVSGLNPHTGQMTLWDTPDEKERRLLNVLDSLQDRFGKKVVQRARELEKHPDDDK